MATEIVYDAHGYLGVNPEFASYGLPETLDGDWWVETMDNCGMTGTLVAPPGVGAPEDFWPDLERVATAVKQHPGRIFGYARAKPRKGKAAIDDLRYWIEDRGLHAVKMNSLDDDYRFDDRALLDPVLEAISEMGVPVLIHTGDTHAETCTPTMVADIAVDFPDTTFIIGHMGYPNSDHELVDAMRRAPNTVTESASVFRRVVIRRAVEEVGADRVLMGSNSPYSPVELAVPMFDVHLPFLSKSQRAAILGGNLARVLGIES